MAKRIIGRDDTYLDLKSPRENIWGKLVKVVDEATEQVSLALNLVPCGVSDEKRLCYFNGEWYRAE